jgi:hypothetical protein
MNRAEDKSSPSRVALRARLNVDFMGVSVGDY